MRSSTPAALLLVAATALGLSACAAAPQPEAQVVVRIAPSASPEDYEVHLARAEGGFRASHTMRSGESRTFAVPAGWLTVRVPGVCVVPAAATGTTTVDVAPDDCRVD